MRLLYEHVVQARHHSLGTFLHTTIRGLGYAAAQVQLLSTPPYICVFIFSASGQRYHMTERF